MNALIRRLFVAVMVLCTVLLAGCGYESQWADPPAGGTSTKVDHIYVSDVYLDGPHGLPAHASAPLRFALTNDSKSSDALVSVTTPVASDVRMLDHGRAVPRIEVRAGTQRNYERRTGLVLDDLKRPLPAGKWFPVTFTFQHAGPVTIRVIAGPLGAKPSSRGEPR